MERAGGEGAGHDNRSMSARLAAFVLWTAVALAATFAVLRAVVRPQPTPAQASRASESGASDYARLLGTPAAVAAAPVPVAPSRYRLAGLIAEQRTPRSAAGGVALIAVDGKPPRAFRLGQRVDGDVVLREVGARSATLAAPGAAPMVLEAPARPAVATGVPVRSADAANVGSTGLGRAAAPPFIPPVPPAPPAPLAGAAGDPPTVPELRGSPQSR